MKPTWLSRSLWGAAGVVGATLTLLGCYSTQPDFTPLAQGPVPRRMPSPARQGPCSYEDSLTGGQVFSMYCGECHNTRPLSERPFAQYQNVAEHMRVRANLTGKEYAKLMEFMRRWHDVPPPTQPDAPSPKRFIFSQPIAELRDQKTPAQPPGNPILPPLDVRNTPAPPGAPAPAVVPAGANSVPAPPDAAGSAAQPSAVVPAGGAVPAAPGQP
jgi:hypothetical protein